MRFLVPLVLVALLGAPAHAERVRMQQAQSMTCEVVEIDASTTGKPSVDPQLKDLKKKLTKGPFSQYDTFVQLARISKSLSVLKSERYDTPKGAVALIIRDIDGKKKRPRVSLGLQLEDQNGKQYLETKMSADAGDYLLFARTVSDKSSIITAVGCK